jgi:hypothetical protein
MVIRGVQIWRRSNFHIPDAICTVETPDSAFVSLGRVLFHKSTTSADLRLRSGVKWGIGVTSDPTGPASARRFGKTRCNVEVMYVHI